MPQTTKTRPTQKWGNRMGVEAECGPWSERRRWHVARASCTKTKAAAALRVKIAGDRGRQQQRGEKDDDKLTNHKRSLRRPSYIFRRRGYGEYLHESLRRACAMTKCRSRGQLPTRARASPIQRCVMLLIASRCRDLVVAVPF